MIHLDLEEEETAIAVYWVTDGIDRCKLGFLRRHHLKEKDAYDNQLAQIVEILSLSENSHARRRSQELGGLCKGAIITM